jgi:hypothetical protein
VKQCKDEESAYNIQMHSWDEMCILHVCILVRRSFGNSMLNLNRPTPTYKCQNVAVYNLVHSSISRPKLHFSSIFRCGNPLSHIKCATGEGFCKIVVKSRISDWIMKFMFPMGLHKGMQSAPKANFFKWIAYLWLKNPSQLNFLSWLKNLDRVRIF